MKICHRCSALLKSQFFLCSDVSLVARAGAMESVVNQIRTMHNATHVDVNRLIWKIVDVAEEMLIDRGCVSVTKPQTEEELDRHIRDFTPVLVGSGATSIRVMFHSEERVAVKVVRQLVENDGFDRTIILSVEGPTSFSKKEAAQCLPTLQFFKYKDLSVNITKHSCVPKHSKVSDPKALSTIDVQLCPKMLQSDVISAWYDFVPGDVVSVRRRFGTTDVAPYYRLVIAG